jgi:hypothetical protein
VMALRDLPQLADLHGLHQYPGGLTALRQLLLDSCNQLRSVALGGLAALQRLDIRDCGGLQQVDLGGLDTLQQLRIVKCRGLQQVPGLEDLMQTLQLVMFQDCGKLPDEHKQGGSAVQQLDVSKYTVLHEVSLSSRSSDLSPVAFACCHVVEPLSCAAASASAAPVAVVCGCMAPQCTWHLALGTWYLCSAAPVLGHTYISLPMPCPHSCS